LRKEREKREKRLDEPGFVLLAGENTDVIYHGTYRECKDNLWRLNMPGENGKRIPRDSYSGKGCWVIVKDGYEIQSGYFDKDMVW